MIGVAEGVRLALPTLGALSQVAKSLGIFVTLPSQRELTVDAIVTRIHDKHDRLTAKVQRKMASEREYYNNRYGFDSSEATGNSG